MKAALVTGASRGIGLAIARMLADEGFALTLAARKAEALESATAALAGSGATVRAQQCDVSDLDALDGLVTGHADAYGRLDLLVLNAGTGTAGPIESYPQKHFDRTFGVNVRSQFALLQLALPLLRTTAGRAGKAEVVAVTSVTGKAPEPGLAAYAASKAAAISLCRSVNLEYAADGVRATSLNPGYVDTDMSGWVHGRIGPESMITAQDVAELVRMLTRLSARAVVPDIDILRVGTGPYEA